MAIIAGALLSCAAPPVVRAALPVERDVAFDNDTTRLAATLIVPASDGRHPAMVLMPGSGVQTREGLLEMARFMAGQGIVTIAYDKRGAGKSAGNWTQESLDDLAGDARAAIGFLKVQPEVDPAAIGAWGISQSGWVLPRLAQRLELRFAICVTGGAVTPREVELFGYEGKLKHNGFSESDRQAARVLVEQYLRYVGTGDGREALLLALHAAREQPWGNVLGIDHVVPDEADRPKWAWVANYDPIADIQALRMPVLVLLGARDPFLPSADALARWSEALAAGGNANDKVIVYPSAGHGIRTNGHDMRSPAVYAPGYLADQIAWLRTIGVLK
jgi:dienelactone hydrolase